MTADVRVAINSGNRLRRLIKAADGTLPPRMTGIQFVRYVAEGRGWDRAHTWTIYVARGDGTPRSKFYHVLALHRWDGRFKILGRALPYAEAFSLARAGRVSDV